MRSAIERLGPRQAVLAREDRIEACDAGRDCDKGDAGQCRVRVSLLEQPLEGYRDEDKDGRLDEVGEDAQPDESGVRDYILTVVAVATAGVDASVFRVSGSLLHEVREWTLILGRSCVWA
jgi:hypothetical protein